MCPGVSICFVRKKTGFVYWGSNTILVFMGNDVNTVHASQYNYTQDSLAQYGNI